MEKLYYVKILMNLSSASRLTNHVTPIIKQYLEHYYYLRAIKTNQTSKFDNYEHN